MPRYTIGNTSVLDMIMAVSGEFQGDTCHTGRAQMLAFAGPRRPTNGETMNIVINGAPFSGTGFGGGSGGDALRPNSTANRSESVAANEDYDAPDCQNMLLSARLPKTGGSVDTVLPSLHRPDRSLS